MTGRESLIADLRRLLDQHAEMMKAEPLGTVSRPHICWATDALSHYLNLLPRLLDELAAE